MAGSLIALLWAVTLAYPVTFLLFGAAYGRKYFRTSPAKEEMNDFDQQENIAYILAGFAIAALSVIISFQGSEVASKETLVEFFSIGFISEIISGFLSHYRITLIFKYFGFAAQYTGVLAIINGFFAFFNQSLPSSPTLFLTFYAGMVAFLLLTLPELYLYRKYWKSL
jgi:hypothetical protein